MLHIISFKTRISIKFKTQTNLLNHQYCFLHGSNKTKNWCLTLEIAVYQQCFGVNGIYFLKVACCKLLRAMHGSKIRLILRQHIRTPQSCLEPKFIQKQKVIKVYVHLKMSFKKWDLTFVLWHFWRISISNTYNLDPFNANTNILEGQEFM